MKKKILILPALFIFIHIGYISCCKCAKAGDGDYTTPLFLQLILFDTKTQTGINVGSSTLADSLVLHPNFTYNCTVQIKNPFAGIVNAAYAFRCDCLTCGDKGLKSKVNKLEITSDSIYNGFGVGQNLASLFRVKNKYSSNSNFFITTDSAIKLFNLEGYGSLSGFEYYINTKPTTAKGHNFTMKYHFADGSFIEKATGRFFWN